MLPVLDGGVNMQKTDLAAAIARLSSIADELEKTLNKADAALGDGDTGTMLVRVIKSMAEANVETAADVGQAFALLAKATIAGTGSSLGTLIATAFMTSAKSCKGQTSVEWRELGRLLHDARDAMLARGGAALGDKTVIDALDATARACDGADTPADLAQRSAAAADLCLEEFRPRVCKIGRARMYEARSIGMDDPGMLAFVLCVRSIAAEA